MHFREALRLGGFLMFVAGVGESRCRNQHQKPVPHGIATRRWGFFHAVTPL